MKSKHDRIGFSGATHIFWLPSPVFNVKASRGCTIVAGALMAINLSLDVWHLCDETGDLDSRFTRATIASLVINSYSVLDAFIRTLKGASPLTWLAERVTFVAGLKDHYLPSKIIRMHASGFFALNLMALVFRFVDMKVAALACLAHAWFSSWVYGFIGVCPIQITYGLLLQYVCIRLRDDERCIILEEQQERCEFSPFGPFVPVCGPDALGGASESSSPSGPRGDEAPRAGREPDHAPSARTAFAGASLAWVNPC